MRIAHWILYHLPVYLYAALIYAVSESAELAATLQAYFYLCLPFLEWMGPRVGGGDKLFHAAEYFFFGMLLVRAFRNARSAGVRRGRYWLALVTVMFYAMTDEFHQLHVVGRSSNLPDWLADCVGSSLGATVYRFGFEARRR